MMRLSFAFVVFGFASTGCGGNSAQSTGSSAGSTAMTPGGASGSTGVPTSGGSGGAPASGGSSGGSAGASASSGSAGVPASGGAGGASALTNPPYYGTVQLGWLGAATFQTLVDARFTNPTVATGSSPCASQTIGACTISTCAAQEGTPAPQAGVIALSDGDKFNVSLTPSADGTYATFSSGGILLPGDQTITVTASGGDIPAFSATVEQPLVLLVTAPPGADGGTFSWARTQDLSLTFQRGMPAVELIVQGGSAGSNLSCLFPSEAGSAVVPAAALAALSAGDTLYVLTATTKRIQAGSYTVDLFAFGTATNLAKSAGILVTLQ